MSWKGIVKVMYYKHLQTLIAQFQMSKVLNALLPSVNNVEKYEKDFENLFPVRGAILNCFQIL